MWHLSEAYSVNSIVGMVSSWSVEADLLFVYFLDYSNCHLDGFSMVRMAAGCSKYVFYGLFRLVDVGAIKFGLAQGHWRQCTYVRKYGDFMDIHLRPSLSGTLRRDTLRIVYDLKNKIMMEPKSLTRDTSGGSSEQPRVVAAMMTAANQLCEYYDKVRSRSALT